jgi:hypothetical protein
MTMNVKKLVLAGLAGFVVMFLLALLWYTVTQGFYTAQFSGIERPEPEASRFIWWIVLGYLVGSFLMAYIYPIGYKGGAPVKEGLRFGLLMGLIMTLPVVLILYGGYSFPQAGLLVDAIYQVIEKTIGGAVIALVYGSSAMVESD